MPLEMKVPKKIPVGRAPSNIDRLEVESVDDGSYIVTCFNKGGGAGDFTAPTKYTFSDVAAMTSFIGDKLSGRDTAAKGEAVGKVAKAVGKTNAKRTGITGESKRRPTRPAGEAGGPAYAETQTDTSEDDEEEAEA